MGHDAPDDLPSGLVRSDPSGRGPRRRRRGRGFSCHDDSGAIVTSRKSLARIRGLAIPPAWRDVWICPDPDGHIQAVGTDAAARRQYRYHDQWRRSRDAAKHDRVLGLGRRLPGLRKEVARRLAGRGLPRERVLAGAVRLLDLGVFRAGGEEYAPDDEDDEGSFGLATLRREHVRVRGATVVFHYPAKGGAERAVRIGDPALARLVSALLRREDDGLDLLVHGSRGSWHDVRAEDLNAAVKELAGDRFTAKDLRTWNATVRAAVALAADGPVPSTARARARRVRAAIDTVADHLGNTAAVARASYVDPRVLDHYEEGRTIARTLRRLRGPPAPSDDAGRAAVDRAVVRLLRG